MFDLEGAYAQLMAELAQKEGRRAVLPKAPNHGKHPNSTAKQKARRRLTPLERALLVLYRRGPLTPSGIADYGNMSTATMRSVLAEIVASKLARMKPAPLVTHPKRELVHLTKSGLLQAEKFDLDHPKNE